MEKISVVGLGQSGSKIANVINNIDNENLICLRDDSEFATSPSLGLDFIINNLAIENKKNN